MLLAETLLKEVKQIMDRLNMTFFLRHGTCLGAVRDGAFIVWDDDIDIGSVIGLHGLTADKVREAAIEFRKYGFAGKVTDGELHMSIDLKKSGVQIDWTCYKIINSNIYQWPVLEIPASLHENLKEINFLGTQFMVPNPPEKYFRLKYGADWMTPKKAGDFEQEVLDLMEDRSESTGAESVLQLNNQHIPLLHTGSLKIVGADGELVSGAEVTIAPTSVLTGLEIARTNEQGFVYFNLPKLAGYVLAIQIDDQKEFLYLERLKPGTDYQYQPDPNHSSGRANALSAL